MLFVNKKYESLNSLLNEKLSPEKVDEFSDWLKSDDAEMLDDNDFNTYKTELKSLGNLSKNENIFDNRGIVETARKEFIKVLTKNDALDLLSRCNSVKCNEFINGNDISEVLGISSKLCGELAQIHNTKKAGDGQQKSVNEGDFEVLLKFFLEGGKDASHGDVRCSEGILEIKSSKNARPGKRRTDVDKIIYKLDDLLSNEDVPQGNRYKGKGTITVKDFFEINSDYIRKAGNNAVAEALVNGVCDQYEVTDRSSLISSAKAFLTDLNSANIRDLIGCLQLAAYSTKEKFTHIVFFKGVTSTRYKCLKKEDLLNFNLVSENLTISTLGSGKNDGDGVAKIGLK